MSPSAHTHAHTPVCSAHPIKHTRKQLRQSLLGLQAPNCCRDVVITSSAQEPLWVMTEIIHIVVVVDEVVSVIVSIISLIDSKLISIYFHS